MAVVPSLATVSQCRSGSGGSWSDSIGQVRSTVGLGRGRTTCALHTQLPRDAHAFERRCMLARGTSGAWPRIASGQCGVAARLSGRGRPDTGGTGGVGLSVRGLSDLERGTRRLPRPDTVRRLARALRLPQAERRALLPTAGERLLPATSSRLSCHSNSPASSAASPSWRSCGACSARLGCSR
jgi:hypothetical protein